MAMDIALTAKKLSKNYGGLKAVSEVDLEVKKGAIFGLVGPDGAGKTTTLRMLSTAIHPDSGAASVLGFDLLSQRGKVKEHIGYMPQHFSLYGDLTVSENIDFYSDLYQVREDTARVRKRELLAANNLEPFKDRLADQLSGGMKKKLALACTLVHTPEILILDEPTTGVDPLSRREFWRILYSLVPEVTILISTPYMDEAERCNEICLMYNGRAMAIDTPKDILKKFKGEILEIKCDCLRELMKALSQAPGIKEVRIFGDSLHVFVDSAAASRPGIESFIAANGLKFSSIRQVGPKLEDVFISILK